MRVAVIGGGIIGLAVTEALSGRKIPVELFERNTELGREASGAAAGILSPQTEAREPGPFWDLLKNGLSCFEAAVKRLEAESGLTLGYRSDGLVELAFTPEDEVALHQNLAWQVSGGSRAERLSAQAARREEPAVSPSVRCGVYWRDNAQVDPVRMTAAYQRILQRRGVPVHRGGEVFRVQVEGGRVRALETGRGLVEADEVVNCSGSWSGWVREHLGPVPVEPVRGQMLEFSVEKPLIRRILHSRRGYLVQRDETRLVAGTTVERVGFDCRATREGEQSIRRGAEEICRSVGLLPLQASWAGLRPDTPDHRPILGPTAVSGFWMATGHYRNGILLAPLTGEMIADGVEGKSPVTDLGPFELSRFFEKEEKQNDSHRSGDSRF